jgi:hypothetical protein
MIMIGIQQISDRMRAAPTQALRAVFAGIGRILLTADRPDSRVAVAQSLDLASGPPSTQHQASEATGMRRDLDKTGNVRLLSAEDMALEFGADRIGRTDEAARPDGGIQASSPVQNHAVQNHAVQNHHAVHNGQADLASRADQAEPSKVTMSAVPTVELPLTGYDELSLASIRARLRNLDVNELRVLAEYERTHAERPDFLGMFERRIEKLEAAD